MRHETNQELFRYWNKIRKDRSSPNRDEIDPATIRHILADTFLIETKPDGKFPIRVSGTRLDALWLTDQKGRCFLDFWGDDRDSIAAALWTVMDEACPIVLGARSAPVGRPSVAVEGLLLPLRHHGQTHSLVLGALSLAEPPSWIGLVPIDRLELVSMRVVSSVQTAAFRTPPARAAMPPAGFLERRGHLTVYAGGR